MQTGEKKRREKKETGTHRITIATIIILVTFSRKNDAAADSRMRAEVQRVEKRCVA